MNRWQNMTMVSKNSRMALASATAGSKSSSPCESARWDSLDLRIGMSGRRLGPVRLPAAAPESQNNR